MASNTFADLTESALLAKGQETNAAITAGGGAYGTSAAQDAALAAAIARFGAGITGSSNTQTAAKAATQEKLGGREDMLAALGSIGGTIYNDPSVTDTMLAEAGYAVHDDVPTKHSPLQPLNLTATPDQFGTVLFTWDVNGNVYPTTYIVQGRASESEPWVDATTTQRRRLKVTGFTPGATHWFRVLARRNGETTIPSNVAGIWENEEIVLEIAA